MNNKKLRQLQIMIILFGVASVLLFSLLLILFLYY
jgi:Na+-transporting methylmalonyl-CoA/oxaloacetate decarboxylase gamma subunit